MKRNLFRTVCNLFTGIAVFLFFSNTAFADLLGPTSSPVTYIIGDSSDKSPSGGLILILGLVSITLTAVAIAIIISIRRKNAK
jgi:hypothetical protein